MLTTVMQIVMLSTITADDGLDVKRMETMLKNGDDRWIVQTLRRYPSETLGFVDQYLEGGLKIIEEGGDVEKARESYRTGLKFAEHADKAFGDELFSSYAAAFGSWSPQEQKEFREGQGKYKEARKLEDSQAALALYQEARMAAAQLGDAWGAAMYQLGVAQSLLKLGRHDEASQAGKQAIEIHGRLRLRMGWVRSNLVVGKAMAETGPYNEAKDHLSRAWSTLVDKDKSELREEVRDALAGILEKTGDTEAAAKLREQPEKEDE